MTWADYYDRFYDWAESTQVRYLSSLSSLGPADEVGEIIIELQVNVPAANRLLRKAVEAKLAFSGSDLVEFACINDKELATAAVRNSAERLTAEDMEYLYGEIDDEVIIEICKQRHLMLPEDLREEEYEDEEPEEIEEDELLAEADIYVDDYCPPPKRPGFFATLFGVIAGIDMASGSNQHRHNGRCNGDCAHCPPHYGYRYGRWYYGHNHVHGCEFGGNKGSGSMD
ncbi:MAG: hypothetical protein ACOX1U_04100 [Saccharofermentanales bacterium]|jgi:hypothetical protein|uniref:hypothetical protein n=1 Tax=Oscillibacter sp. TaxID=1945593 RepID=UPI002049951F|nr:hypothetical protein [Oscillibacter sp.]DAG12450.1 MAG TPA: hypothetical protein [Caudoviricetes sp.]